MSDRPPLAEHAFEAGGVASALEFLKRTRDELRLLRKVRVWHDRLQVFDINGDYFEIQGIGYPDADIVPLLNAVHTNFKPQTIAAEFSGEYKEFLTGRRRPWAPDRVM